MNNHFREIVFSFLGFFFKDFKYIKPDYIKGVGKYKFINNYLIGSLSGKKGFWKLVNKNSVIIEPENILINGEIKKSKLMKSLIPYKQSYSFQEGLIETIAWIKKNKILFNKNDYNI